MSKYYKWIPIIIAALIMIWQEDLYFNTIWELKIGSVNIWEINRLFPSLIAFVILTVIYALILLGVNKMKLTKASFNAISLGIIAILSSGSISMALYINKSTASTKQEIITYKITNYAMMSGRKTGKDYPSIFIDCGHPNKRISLRKYSKEFVYSKKEAVLKVRRGYFGWQVIDEIELK